MPMKADTILSAKARDCGTNANATNAGMFTHLESSRLGKRRYRSANEKPASRIAMKPATISEH
jgi:hypothetical protein